MIQRLALGLVAAVLVACGSSNSDLTSGSGGSTKDASGTGGSGTGGTAGGGATGGTAGSATGGSGTGGTSGTAGGGATGGTGGSGVGGTGGAGAGGTGATGGGGTGGSGGQPAAGKVGCGLETCALSTQSCCFGDNVTPYCYKSGTFNGCKCTGILCEKAIVDCDGPEDCGAGQVCCATKGITGSHFDRLSCAKTCQGGIGVTAAVVCHLNSASTCPNGNSCVSDPRLPGSYGLCAP